MLARSPSRAVAEIEIPFQPGDDLRRLYIGTGKPDLFCQGMEILRRLSSFGLDVVDIGFKCHCGSCY
jgi:hypothetical protein